ncbi:replicative DNA helicase [Bacteroides eggerthii]|jgi:replicative DNA helicase|uniref:replicative DNA helicase n=1 Tax=Bacteroides eggerthii TaxID=28111 RepID=UPI000E46B2A0|nr:replicative DNA helicase [Bacteroides eggerthii]RHJ36450.1 replicative DNA helicase [Bacteroides eggerthii]
MSEILNPHDDDLESVILGACLTETTAMVLVGDKLSPEMFYETKFGEIYSALLSMYHSGKAIDLVTVRAELASRGKLEAVGGAYELVRLAGRVASSAHLEYHALILRQMYIRREMIAGLHTLLASAADESVDLSDALADLHRLAGHLESGAVSNNCLRDMERLMQDTLEQMDKRVENNRNGITGIPTGLRELDRLTAGWQQGDLNIIAARPSVGKTAFALHLALAAGRAGKHVLVNSLEMQGERLGDRWLCAQAANVDAGHLKTGLLDAGERQQALEAARLLSALPVYVDDNPKMSMDHIRSSALLQKSKGRCDLLIIDYLQLCEMKSGQKNRNREQEVAEASRKAKLIAKELDIPVILLCQLNRECEMRADKRPALSDLRESGAIEQDADVVMLLYRPALYGLTSERRSKFPSEGLGMVILAKHRNVETGDVYFGHNPAMTKIGEYVPPTEWMMRNAK